MEFFEKVSQGVSKKDAVDALAKWVDLAIAKEENPMNSKAYASLLIKGYATMTADLSDAPGVPAVVQEL